MGTNTYLIIGAFLIFSICILFSCKPKQNKQKGSSNVVETKLQENPYDRLRFMSLNITPDQLEIEMSEEETKVFGIVMDWDVGNGIATLVTYETGDASMYLSSGGAVIGGGQHENVRNAVFQYIKLGQGYLTEATKTETTPLPDKDCMRFYLLTNNGIYSAQEKMQNIENESSDWLELFTEAQNVLTELRLISEN